MKILIQNYTSMLSTEAMYFAKCLEIAKQDVFLWNDPNMSTFDVFDSFKPEVFITHWQFISNDTIKYLTQDKGIQLVLNISGITNEQLDSIAEIVKKNEINCPFVFTNAHNVFTKPETSVKDAFTVETILPGADIFLPPSIDVGDVELEAGVVATEMSKEIEDYVENKDTYHLLKLSTSPEVDKNFDMPVNIMTLIALYGKYKQVACFTEVNTALTQLFYDATLNSKNIKFFVPEDQKSTLNEFVESIFSPEDETLEDLVISELGKMIKDTIKKHHTCVNRSIDLCKLLKNSEALSVLEKTGFSFKAGGK